MHYSARTLAGIAICGFALIVCDSTRPFSQPRWLSRINRRGRPHKRQTIES